jgi:hypothetical protein
MGYGSRQYRYEVCRKWASNQAANKQHKEKEDGDIFGDLLARALIEQPTSDAGPGTLASRQSTGF